MDANKTYCGDHFVIYISHYVVHLKFIWCCMSIVSQQNWNKVPVFPNSWGFYSGCWPLQNPKLPKMTRRGQVRAPEIQSWSYQPCSAPTGLLLWDTFTIFLQVTMWIGWVMVGPGWYPEAIDCKVSETTSPVLYLKMTLGRSDKPTDRFILWGCQTQVRVEGLWLSREVWNLSPCPFEISRWRSLCSVAFGTYLRIRTLCSGITDTFLASLYILPEALNFRADGNRLEKLWSGDYFTSAIIDHLIWNLTFFLLVSLIVQFEYWASVTHPDCIHLSWSHIRQTEWQLDHHHQMVYFLE